MNKKGNKYLVRIRRSSLRDLHITHSAVTLLGDSDERLFQARSIFYDERPISGNPKVAREIYPSREWVELLDRKGNPVALLWPSLVEKVKVKKVKKISNNSGSNHEYTVNNNLAS
jgi:hypothetical protein